MANGVRRLSHDEAEQLISARMDEPIEPAESRALLVHLQTCESCRAFAVQTEILGRELAALPVLPASAAVARQMRETIAQGNRGSLTSMLPSMGRGGLTTAIAAAALLALISVFLLIRLGVDQSVGDNGGAINAPNGQVALNPSTSTAGAAVNGAPSETSTGTDVPPTETARSVAAPEITSTPRLIETGTSDAEPSATAQPTQTEESVGDPTEPALAPPRDPTETISIAAVDPAEETGVGGGDPSTATAESTTEPTESTQTPANDDVAVAALIEDGAATPDLSTGNLALTTAGTAETGSPDSTSEQEPEPTPSETEASELPETATLEPTATATEKPTETATAEPTETLPPSPTDVVEPTVQTIQPQSTATGTPQPTVTATATRASSGSPVASEPALQPTIAPVDGTDIQSIEPNDAGTNQQAASGGAATQGIESIAPEEQESIGQAQPETNDQRIVPVDGVVEDKAPTSIEDSNVLPSGQPGIGGAEPAGEPGGLDRSQTVAPLPPGVSSPAGRLEFSPSFELFALFAPDGQLAIADIGGSLVATLGIGDLPIWAGSSLMYRSGDSVSVWDAATGEIWQLGDGSGNDVPAGWDGAYYYYLRSFPGQPGHMALRSTNLDGSDDGLVWESFETELSGERPLMTVDGVLIPTATDWRLIGLDGSETGMGPNQYGYIGAPVLSPGGGLLAYAAGGQVVVALTENPGSGYGIVQSGGWYAFSTSGEEVVVSDGSSLGLYTNQGEPLGSATGVYSIGAPNWLEDSIYYLQVGGESALKIASASEVMSETD